MNINRLGYAAGFFDADGCVGYYRRGGKGMSSNHFRAVLIWTNTDRGAIDTVREIIGCGSIMTRERASANSTKPTYVLQVVSRQARQVLKAMLPHLTVKRERAEWVLAQPVRQKTDGGLVSTGSASLLQSERQGSNP